MAARSLTDLLVEIRACEVCAASLPEGPRPIVQAAPSASIVIIGQAPGRRVHESGVPWDDPSGETLRAWMGIDRDTFYDPNVVALVPMGFCYPGVCEVGRQATSQGVCAAVARAVAGSPGAAGPSTS